MSYAQHLHAKTKCSHTSSNNDKKNNIEYKREFETNFTMNEQISNQNYHPLCKRFKWVLKGGQFSDGYTTKKRIPTFCKKPIVMKKQKVCGKQSGVERISVTKPKV